MIRGAFSKVGIVTVALALFLAGSGCRRAEDSRAASPRAVEEMNRGVSLMGQYLYDDAVGAFEGVLKLEPGLIEARLNLAIALFNRNRKDDLNSAGGLIDAVLLQEPDNLRALYFRAVILQHVGKAEVAVECLNRVLQRRPEDGAAWYLLALCKQRLNQPAEADFQRAVRYRPYLYSGYYQLYQLALRAGEEAKATEYLRRFKELRGSPLGESIELPQYNQMGDLALVLPFSNRNASAPAQSRYRLQALKPILVGTQTVSSGPQIPPSPPGGAAIGDLDQDGMADLVIPLAPPGRLRLLRQSVAGGFEAVTPGPGLDSVTDAVSCALGDVNNDGLPDLLVTCQTGARLFLNQGKCSFQEAGGGGSPRQASLEARSALFLDADHDGDLDLFVCGSEANQLWNNNGDGSFTNVASQAAIECPAGNSQLVLPGDVDNDRDLDLVVLPAGRPGRLFLNDLLGQYREAELQGPEVHGDAGGLLQDLNGDGMLDLLVMGGHPRELRLLLGSGHGRFEAAPGFDSCAKAAASWGPLGGFRVADLDLDGDSDIVCYGAVLHVLLNQGRGRFSSQAPLQQFAPDAVPQDMEVMDVNGDLTPDVVWLEAGGTPRVCLSLGVLEPPSTALAIQPSGVRSRDGRTRSSASGYGVTLTVRAGLQEQRWLHTGQSGGAGQSWRPIVFGLGGAGKADYVDLRWPDGVAQVETAVVAGQTHGVSEMQRKISSCPVLFSWNGERFGFITDFAGVGGLGYFAAPGVSAPPQVEEHVKIEPGQLLPREGRYELRITEPMEEAAYIDRLELLAVDHAAGDSVYPDERLAIGGPPPTHDLLLVGQPIFPVAATDPSGGDCLDRLARIDRCYAYEPALDRRYIGFCQPHTLTLDFGTRLAKLERADRVFLFINGFIEYPYSQTVYAASQSGVGWEAIRVDVQEPGGSWKTVVPDGGVPGGMARTMTIELTGQLPSDWRRMRLTTNLEVCYDQIFLACPQDRENAMVRTVPLREAQLRYLGFAREYSPDGRQPLIFDYDLRDATAPFQVPRGAYTRYGPVEELLANFDDRYVLAGPGDEIALSFDAAALPVTPPGQVRSFVLVSHAYCKDMDLYTATPQTLGPLPFRAMSRYPYPADEQYPTDAQHVEYQRRYNTRVID